MSCETRLQMRSFASATMRLIHRNASANVGKSKENRRFNTLVVLSREFISVALLQFAGQAICVLALISLFHSKRNTLDQ